jgi:hypothetical protein
MARAALHPYVIHLEKHQSDIWCKSWHCTLVKANFKATNFMSPSQVVNNWNQSWDTPIVTTSTKESPLDCERIVKRVCTNYRRVPCRARSLSETHNNDTAYFDIPRNAPHGMQLQCSHDECVLSGRRFRYCEGKQIIVSRVC